MFLTISSTDLVAGLLEAHVVGSVGKIWIRGTNARSLLLLLNIEGTCLPIIKLPQKYT